MKTQYSILKSLNKFLTYMWKHNDLKSKSCLILSLIVLIVSKIIMIMVPIVYKNIINIISNNPINIPIVLIFMYGFSRFIIQLFSDIKDILASFMEQSMVKQVNINTFTHLLNLDYFFHSNRKTGEIIKIIERASKSIERIMTLSFMIMLPILLETFIASVFLYVTYTDHKIYTFIILVSILIYIYYTLKISNWRSSFIKDMLKIDNKTGSQSLDILINYDTVKSFANEDYEIKRYTKQCNKYKKFAIKNKINLAILNTGQGFIISLCLLPIVLLTSKDVIQNNITIGDFVLINTILLQLFIPLGNLGFSYREIRIGLISMIELFEILNVKPKIIDSKKSKNIQIQEGKIIFDNVNFSYNTKNKLIKDLNLILEPKKTTAIVGKTGSGKSTISKIIMRFFDINTGKIIIDNNKINHFTQNSLRRQISYVSQDIILFNDTIKENIRYGRLNATDQEVYEAAKAAQIHDMIIKTVNGYESIVGERGIKLSGGEKQRIAIARAIIKKTKIFIFDESTSSLDTTTEREIQNQIYKISKNKTTLIIAHRLSTIVHADQIIVFDNGKIQEQGTHKELLDKKSKYYQMWLSQKKC